jgi:hypothetical protein
MKLVDVARVHDGDSRWTAGLTVEALQCSLHSATAGLCLPAPAGLSVREGEPSGMPLSPFATIVYMRRSSMCQATDPEEFVGRALIAEREKSAGRALWYGTGNATLWLGADGVTPLPADTGIGEALKAFYDNTVGIEPIIHMGLQRALETVGLNSEGRFKAYDDIPIVVNPSYPADAFAITGPIELWFGPGETLLEYDTAVNRQDTVAQMFGAVSFDPCAAFVVGTPPDQVYVGVDSGTATAFVYDSDAGSTVDWGDQEVRNVTNKALTANVATLTVGAHTLLVGQSVVVAGVDATFNGTYTITAKTATTISYAKVNANVASTAATGTVTRNAATANIGAGSTTGVTRAFAPGTYTITVTAASGVTTYQITV